MARLAPQRAGDVARDVDVRVLGRVADAGLGRQVHHPVGAMAGEGLLHRGTVGQVGLHVGVARLVHEAGQARLLQVDVVVVVEAVEAHHLVPALQQAECDMAADEAGGAGDEDFHAGGSGR
jgi:hypothetical protein